MTINLSELLQILPDVMLLLIPGYFYWYCYNRMNATYYNAYHETKVLSIRNVVTSFIIQTVLHLFPFMNNIELITASLLMGAGTGLLFGCISQTEPVHQFFIKTLHTSNDETLWDCLSEIKNGSFISVVVDGKRYDGTLLAFYQEGNSQWVVLRNCEVDGKEDTIKGLRTALRLDNCSVITAAFPEGSEKNG